jgi:arginine exporter protein ArgO
MFRDSISKFFKIDSLISNLTGYVETRIELLKIEAKDEIAKGLSKVIVYFLLAFVFAVFLIFFSVALAMAIAESLGTFAAFGIVSGVYLLIGIGLFLARTNLMSRLQQEITSQLKKKKNE